MLQKGYVFWSIYVASSSEMKVRQVHLPLISEALEGVQFKWDVFQEEGNPTETRCVNYQNFEFEHSDEMILPILRRAYRLANNWTILGLNEMFSRQSSYCIGSAIVKPPASHAPAVSNLMFEFVLGHTSGQSKSGGWKTR